MHPLTDFVYGPTLEMAQRCQDLIQWVGDDEKGRISLAYGALMTTLDPRYYLYSRGVLTLHLFTEELCDHLVSVADCNKDLFASNEEEGEAYRIPELITADYRDMEELDDLLKEIGREVLWPIFHVMFGNPPNYFSSVQFARYEHPTNVGTGWHSDTTSEASCVVSLAPELHEGGGTILMPDGAFGPPMYIDPLPKGHAILFNGRKTLHRGLELKSGVRNLMVYWMGNREDC